MNLFLHGIGGEESPIRDGIDALAQTPSTFYDVVLTNPPFGKKSSITVVSEEGEETKEALTYYRDDFWATTSNKQLNFLQHVKSLVKIHGRVAIVVPDNVLFEGGAGETVRRKLLHECDVHTLLRLPTGIFYAQGVKANVLFFDRKPASETPWTKKLWIYDFRTNEHFTLKTNPLKREDLDEFVASYHPSNRHERKATWSEKKPEGRWRARDIAIQKLAKVGLTEDVAFLSPAELSGGMQKRVGLARAIAADPEIIFFDEPTTGLDPIMADIINHLIVSTVKDVGATALSITHDMVSARKISDKIAMLYGGKIIWQGPTGEIDNSGNPYVEQFIHGRAEGPIKMAVKA